MATSPRALRAAAAVELVTVVVLLVNLATAHWPAVSSAVGPLHGCAYALVVVLAWPGGARARLSALVPGVGGLLVLRRTGVRPASGSRTCSTRSPG
ncbi:DUF3817 domain-containing protein [Saccharothrix xinjiangensis]|uniref:DUF3817 domain-containing protein n=1 Tax=Saccharothrix xinjiangensis TaxID=204798 RepID=A0ABV9YDH8_9PSEU